MNLPTEEELNNPENWSEPITDIRAHLREKLQDPKTCTVCGRSDRDLSEFQICERDRTAKKTEYDLLITDTLCPDCRQWATDRIVALL